MSDLKNECCVEPKTTYGWLSHNPLTAAAGNAILSWYRGSKNYSRLTNFVFSTAESSVKLAADTAAPFVKKFETPANIVDDFTLRQLQKLENKVPVLTKQPSELLADSKEAIYNGLQAGSEALSNSRAGHIVGNGMGRTLGATEKLLDYLLPADEDEKENEPVLESRKEETENKETTAPSKTRITSISRKIKVRVYYRTVRRIQVRQQQCKLALEQLKAHVDVLQYAANARDTVVQKCHAVQSAVKNAEDQIAKMWKERQAKTLSIPEEDEDIEWLTKKNDRTQAAFDYAKHFSGVIYNKLQYVSNVTSYLPHQLKDGAAQAFNYAQDLYTTLALAKSASDLSSSALNRISGIVESQMNYVRQLGSYLSDTLKARSSFLSSGTRGNQSEHISNEAEVEMEEKSEEEELMDEGSSDEKQEKKDAVPTD